jgi:hypothetical protein
MQNGKLRKKRKTLQNIRKIGEKRKNEKKERRQEMNT